MPRLNVLILLLEYIDLFQSQWQHETNIWKGYPALYQFVLLYFILCIAIITIHILFEFSPIMPRIMPAFCSLLLPSYYSNNFPAKSVYPYSSESWHFHGQKQWLVSGWIVSQSFMCNVRLYRSNFDNWRVSKCDYEL